jgi:precorrin-6A/cobalt-precorrin-6A reductase
VPHGQLAQRVLILGGTAEARALAEALVGRAVVLTSLAGAVATPLLPPGELRVGGFGGTAGLSAFIDSWRPDMVVDATHPFDATITAHAAEVVDSLLVLQRPAWTATPDWTLFVSLADCARAVREMPDSCVFLTTGGRDLSPFASDDLHSYLVRSIEPPSAALPPRCTVVLERGPYTVDDELALMTAHGVDVLIARNSGGSMTAAKLTAARRLGVPVLMVERPPLPVGADVVTDVDAALARLGL